MRFNVPLLTLFLAAGFSMPNCVDCDCSKLTLPYFDIKGVQLLLFKARECCSKSLVPYTAVEAEDLQQITLFYEAEFLTRLGGSPSECKHWSWMPSLWACSCEDPGYKGAKLEMLDTLVVTTLYDYDANHPAGSALNDLLRINDHTGHTPLDVFLAKPQTLIPSQWNQLSLVNAAQVRDTFQVHVTLKLSNQETYQATSVPIILR